jgi:hypothetical protein
MRGPREAIVERRRVAQLPFFRFTSASSSFIGIYFRFLIFYWLNAQIYEEILKELKRRASKRGTELKFTAKQLRTKF